MRLAPYDSNRGPQRCEVSEVFQRMGCFTGQNHPDTGVVRQVTTSTTQLFLPLSLHSLATSDACPLTNVSLLPAVAIKFALGEKRLARKYLIWYEGLVQAR